jgi:hypothetical protein
MRSNLSSIGSLVSLVVTKSFKHSCAFLHGTEHGIHNKCRVMNSWWSLSGLKTCARRTIWCVATNHRNTINEVMMEVWEMEVNVLSS